MLPASFTVKGKASARLAGITGRRYSMFVLAVAVFALLTCLSSTAGTTTLSRRRSSYIFAFFFPPGSEKAHERWKRLQRAASPYHELLFPSPESPTREMQARLAREYNLDGFIYTYAWAGMSGLLGAFLEDGKPNITFALCWANEIDTHGIEEADTHYGVLVKFWVHPLHLRHPNGAVPFFIQRISNDNRPRLFAIVSRWRVLASLDGISLHVVELLHGPHEKVVPWVDGVGEWWPDFWSHSPPLHRCHYPGTYVGWNNSPRHMFNHNATVLHRPSSTLERDLRIVLRRSRAIPPDCFQLVLLSSWNQWNDGNALIPDLVYGKERLLRVASATKDRPRASVCVVARTYAKQKEHLFYNVSAFLWSLALSSVPAHVLLLPTDFPTDGAYVPYLEELASTYSHVSVLHPPLEMRTPFDSCLSAYHLSDWGVRQCPPDTEWVLLTNADNSYGRQAFGELKDVSSDTDLFLLPMRNRYFRWNSFKYQKKLFPDCSSVSDSVVDARVKPIEGMTDIGQVLIRFRRLLDEEVFFSSFYPKVCQAEDSAVFSQLLLSGWVYKGAKRSGNVETYFMHNPNPDSCFILGGVWLDSPDFRRFSCVAASNAPRPLRSVASLFNSFQCAIDMKGEWIAAPVLQPTASNVAAARIIAQILLRTAASCGVRFDSDFYASVHRLSKQNYEEEWQQRGFVSGKRYRWKRSCDFSPLQWRSGTCFLLRALGSQSIVTGETRILRQSCFGSPNKVAFGSLISLREACRKDVGAAQPVSLLLPCTYDEVCAVLRNPDHDLSVAAYNVAAKCGGCIPAPKANPLVAYTCGFRVDTYWVTEAEATLCLVQAPENLKGNCRVV